MKKLILVLIISILSAQAKNMTYFGIEYPDHPKNLKLTDYEKDVINQLKNERKEEKKLKDWDAKNKWLEHERHRRDGPPE